VLTVLKNFEESGFFPVQFTLIAEQAKQKQGKAKMLNFCEYEKIVCFVCI